MNCRTHSAIPNSKSDKIGYETKFTKELGEDRVKLSFVRLSEHRRQLIVFKASDSANVDVHAGYSYTYS